LPQLTDAFKRGNQRHFKNIMQNSFDVMAIIALPLMTGAQFVATPLMRLLAGPDFFAAGPILRLLIFAAGAVYLGVIFSHAIIALEKQKQTIWAYVFVAITALIGYLIFIPKYSYFGAATVTIYSETAIATLIFFITYQYTKFVPNFIIVAKSLSACATMALFLYLTNLNLVITLSLAVLIYVATFYILAKNNLQTMLKE